MLPLLPNKYRQQNRTFLRARDSKQNCMMCEKYGQRIEKQKLRFERVIQMTMLQCYNF